MDLNLPDPRSACNLSSEADSFEASYLSCVSDPNASLRAKRHLSPAMDCQNWIVDDSATCHEIFPNPHTSAVEPYRLYRFLTELEDVLAAIPDDRQRLEAIVPRVRTLLESSYWLQMEFDRPLPNPGWSVKFLFRDEGFPLTVQMVAWLPGKPSPIHNHACWGTVAIVSGEEKNRIYRRSPAPGRPDRIELVAEKVLVPGDIIGFTPEAIHSVEPLGSEPTISFNLYGVTDFERRLEFDPVAQTAKKF